MRAPADIFEHIMRRPGLVKPDVVTALLGWSYAQLMAAVEEGRIQWMWDISRSKERRRAFRFWLPDVLCAMHGDVLRADMGRLWAARGPADAVLDAVLGATMRRWWWGGDVARLLSCSTQHVTGLLADGELQLYHSSEGHASAQSGRRITAESLRGFLTRRRC
jgi:hypothetical protein